MKRKIRGVIGFLLTGVMFWIAVRLYDGLPVHSTFCLPVLASSALIFVHANKDWLDE